MDNLSEVRLGSPSSIWQRTGLHDGREPKSCLRGTQGLGKARKIFDLVSSPPASRPPCQTIPTLPVNENKWFAICKMWLQGELLYGNKSPECSRPLGSSQVKVPGLQLQPPAHLPLPET